MSFGYDTLEHLDREIARIEALIAKNSYQFKHTARLKVESLKRMRMRFTHPRQHALRVWLSEKFLELSYWVY